MNFQISVLWTALTSVHLFNSKYGAASLPEKAQDVDDLRQNLIDAWFEWNKALLTTALITGADISLLAFEPQQDILNIHWYKLAKTLLSVINYVKIIVKRDINFVSDCW